MNKVKATAWMAAVTLAASGLMMGAGWLAQHSRDTENVAQVRACTVAQGCVEQVTVLQGILRYENEHAALCPVNGLVSAVYVQPGDRVSQGQALFRMEDGAQTAALASALSREQEFALPVIQGVDLSSVEENALREQQLLVQSAMATLDSMTVRAPEDAVVQQVYVQENNGLLSGAPGVMLSGEKQEVRCQAVVKDAQQLAAGMQARILYDGEIVQTGTVGTIGTVEASNGQSVCPVTVIPAGTVDLPLGAVVSVEIIRQQARDVPVLPLQALSDGDTLRWIADGRCYDMDVQVLLADEARCWVDLPVGTLVVLDGDETVSGQRVQVTAQ